MAGIKNPVCTDQVDQTHALEIGVMFHWNHDEGQGDTRIGKVLL